MSVALLSACAPGFFGYSCDDVPPSWYGDILVPESLPGAEVYQCVVTASRGSSSIEFDITPNIDAPTCARVGDTENDDCGFYLSNGCWVFDGGLSWCKTDEAFQQWELRLAASDEAYLGGVDFDLTVSCNGTTLQQSHETFDTQRCEK